VYLSEKHGNYSTKQIKNEVYKGKQRKNIKPNAISCSYWTEQIVVDRFHRIRQRNIRHDNVYILLLFFYKKDKENSRLKNTYVSFPKIAIIYYTLHKR